MSPAPASPVTDQQLLARVVVSDDRHAFSELVRRHQSAVRATLRKLAGGNAALADDLAQETFLLAYRNLKSFRQDAKFSTWLYRIAYNVFLGDARKIKELPMPEDMDVDALSPAPDLAEKEQPARQAALRIDLERAMSVLSDAEKAAIVQCYHNDLSHEEAAEVLGCPVGTVKTHVLRAKQKLKARLGAWAPGL
jgi:RNA polymerase sigma factor (sigma-70 family)